MAAATGATSAVLERQEHCYAAADDTLNAVPMSFDWSCVGMDGLSPCFPDHPTYMPTQEGAAYSIDLTKVSMALNTCAHA